jgi:two-component system, NtrC family, C4-dicarboxylate transport sensor histidine kinase DctB
MVSNCYLRVADNGAGLIDDQQKIFDAFYSTKPGGMGLGLALTRSMLELYGGSIDASTNEYGGASFYVRLPVEAV